ncbi:MAG TPA: PDZ domain-containing protein [Pirellulales bacterium]
MHKKFGWLRPTLAVAAAWWAWTLAAPAPAQTRENSANNRANSSRADDEADDDDDGEDQQQDRDERRASNRSSRSRNQHAALGVTFYNEPNMLEVRRVMPDSPAEEAGLRRGDEILGVNNHRVTSIQQLTQALDRAGEDESVELDILRNGRRQTVDATLASRQEVFGQQRGQNNQRGLSNRSAQRDWRQDQWSGQGQGGGRNQWSGQNQWAGQNEGSGQGRQNWQDDDNDFRYGRQDYGNRAYNDSRMRNMNAGQNQRWREGYRGGGAYLGVFLDRNDDGQRGVWITGVQPGSPAEQAGLRRGDEIVAIDDEDVESNQDVMHLLSQMTPNEEVEVSIERNGRQRTLQAMLAPRQQNSAQNRSYRTGRRSQANVDDSGFDGQYNQPYNRGYGNSGGYGQNDNRNNRNSYGMADYDNDYGEQGYANQGYNSDYNAGAGNARRGGAYYDTRTYGRRYQDQQDQYDNF